ncbi:MAG: murein biosynthesis integral membrane protein MurJ [Alphaproteobacteria bacterium]|nr:MAG: murein biosynthesis integral membrane protein MurJ [Alphaproteobacteria bacterium]
MALGRSVFTVGGLTFLSRLLGMVRDMVTAAYLGAGPIADAVFVAFRLPNLFRSLFAEGAFSIAFVPKFTDILTRQGRDNAFLFAEQAMALLFGAVMALVVLGEIMMPVIMRVVAPGFSDDTGQFASVIEFARITFPYILLMSMVALQGGVMNSLGKFYAFAASPCIMNVVMIIAMVVITPLSQSAGHAFAFGVLASGIAQWAWMAYAMHSDAVILRPKWPVLSDDMKTMLRAIVPAALGSGALQVNILIGVMIGSFLPIGSISYLYYADRINQFPLGVVGIAIGTVLLPVLSKHISAGDAAEAARQQNRGLEMGLLLSVPATIGLLVIPLPVIDVLFARGAFDYEAARQTAYALAAFALGLPAYVMMKALSPGFFARGDTKTPVKIAFVCVAINTLLNLLLMGLMQHVGIALGTSIASWINAYLLAAALQSKGFWQADAQLKSRSLKILIASLVMGAVVWLLQMELESWLLGHFAQKLLALLTLVAAGVIVYGALVLILGAVSIAELRTLRKPKYSQSD